METELLGRVGLPVDLPATGLHHTPNVRAPHAGRDVVRLRTNVRGEEVHVCRLDVPAADAHVLLLRYLEEVNQLRERPQWYNALTDNCTTAIQRLARSGERQSWWSWKLFVNGYLDELAYDIGAIDRSLPSPVGIVPSAPF